MPFRVSSPRKGKALLAPIVRLVEFNAALSRVSQESRRLRLLTLTTMPIRLCYRLVLVHVRVSGDTTQNMVEGSLIPYNHAGFELI